MQAAIPPRIFSQLGVKSPVSGRFLSDRPVGGLIPANPDIFGDFRQ